MSWNIPRSSTSIQPGKGKVDEDIGTSGYYNSKSMNTLSSGKNTAVGNVRSTRNTGAYAGESDDPALLAKKSENLRTLKFTKKNKAGSHDINFGRKSEDHTDQSIDLSKDTPPPSLPSQAEPKRLPPLGMTGHWGQKRRNPSGPNRGVLVTAKRRPEHRLDHDEFDHEDEFGMWGSNRDSPADQPAQSTSNHNTRSSEPTKPVSKPSAPSTMPWDDSTDDIQIVPVAPSRKTPAAQPAPFPVSFSAEPTPDVTKPTNSRPDKGKGKAKASLARLPRASERMTRSTSGKIIISSDDNEEVPAPLHNSPPRPKAKAFPMQLSPVRVQDSSDEPEEAHARTSPPRPKAKAFPMHLSPIRSQPDPESHKEAISKPSGSRDVPPKKDVKTAPAVKSLSPGRTNRKVKPRPIVKPAKGLAPKAFPMSMESGPMEDCFSQAESEFSSAAEALDAMGDAASDMDDLFLDANLDPKKLCPYCDVPLPEYPTTQLRKLLDEVRKKSRPEPRPSNPLGLRADVGFYVLVCDRHKFESKWMPKAQANGWPTHIDFTEVRRRVEDMQPHLQSIVDSIVESTFAAGHDISTSTFWEDVMGSRRGAGAKAAEGVTAQFSSFEKTQPGYYGELGALTIQQTLYLLFPPGSVDLKIISPLSHSAFVSQVLVPEAALSLIQQDLQQSKEDALLTMRESAPYGVALFPDDSRGLNGTQGISEADRIMQHRANARRKELEEFETSMEDLFVPTFDSPAASHHSYGSDEDVGDETILAIVPPAHSRKRVERSTSDLTAASDDPKPRPQHKRQKTPTLRPPPVVSSQASSPSRPTGTSRNRRKPLTQTNIDNTMEVAGPSKPRAEAAPTRRSRSRSCASNDCVIEINDTPKQKKTCTTKYMDAGHSSSESDDLHVLPVRAASEAASIEMISDKDELTAKVQSKGRATKRSAAVFPMAAELAGGKVKPPAPRKASKLAKPDNSNSDVEQSDASIPRTTRSRKSSPPKETNLAWLVDSD